MVCCMSDANAHTDVTSTEVNQPINLKAWVGHAKLKTVLRAKSILRTFYGLFLRRKF